VHVAAFWDGRRHAVVRRAV